MLTAQSDILPLHNKLWADFDEIFRIDLQWYKRGVTPCRIAPTDEKRKRLFSISSYQFRIRCLYACRLVTCGEMRSSSGEVGSIRWQVLSMHKSWNGRRTEKVPTGCALDMRFIRTSCVWRPVLISSRLLQLRWCSVDPDLRRTTTWRATHGELMNKGKMTDG